MPDKERNIAMVRHYWEKRYAARAIDEIDTSLFSQYQPLRYALGQYLIWESLVSELVKGLPI